jgi:hypothetical protein
VVWQKTYDNGRSDYTYFIQQTPEGGYVMGGSTDIGAYYDSIWILKLNSDGTIAWQKTYGGSDYWGGLAVSIQKTSEGGYIAAGISGNTDDFSDALILKVDINGEITGCPVIEASNATVNATSATITDTSVAWIDTSVPLQTNTASLVDTSSMVTEICYYAPPTIGFSPTSFSFTATQGGSNPANQILNIWNAGDGTLNWSVNDDATWLSLSPMSGTNSGTVTLSVNITGLTTGTYNATITITAPGATNSPINIPVTLTINPPTLTLLSPNGSEIIPSGSTYAIQWSAPPEAVKFTLTYSKDNGTTWNLIANNVIGTSYDWQVPALLNNKKQCLVKVKAFNSEGVMIGKDKSDSVFTIEVVKLTSPDGGEVLTSGTPHTITWTNNATKNPVASVKLVYTTNGGTTWILIDTPTGNPGSYEWTVPDVTSSSCKVKVVLKDTTGTAVGKDASDGFFTIQP